MAAMQSFLADYEAGKLALLEGGGWFIAGTPLINDGCFNPWWSEGGFDREQRFFACLDRRRED